MLLWKTGGEKKINRSEEKSKAAKHREAAWPCFSLNEGYTAIPPVFHVRENFMQLIKYEDIVKLLNLDIKNKDFDELCLNAAYEEIEKSIGYPVDEKECCEVLTVQDNRVILDAINISEVIEITDLTTKNQIYYFTVDYENKCIYFVPAKTDDHIIFVNYKAGFTKENFPADLKEVIIKLFLLKQIKLNKINNGDTEQNENNLPSEITDTIKRYSRKKI